MLRDIWPYINMRLHHHVGPDAVVPDRDYVPKASLALVLPAITLVGPAKLARAWTQAFCGVPDITVVRGNIFDQPGGTALVSAANSFGVMQGGLDAQYVRAYRQHNVDIQTRVIESIFACYHGELPVGQALVVPTPEHPQWPFLIVAPTMRTPQTISRSMNPYLAFRALLLAISDWNNRHQEAQITQLACPGLGTGVGHIAPSRAARQMRAAWDAVHGLSNLTVVSLTQLWLAERRLRFF